MNGISTISCMIQDVIPEPLGIRIEWADEEASFFEYRWLAEHAPELRKRQGHGVQCPGTLPRNLRPLYIQLHPNNVLEMEWNELPHTTWFSTVWLRQHSPTVSELPLTEVTPSL